MQHHESVPVDQRWLGLDKRGVPYAVVAVALIFVLHWVVPAVDSATDWDNPTVAGDALDLGSGIRMTPPVGWQLEEGIRLGEEPLIPVRADGSSVTLANGAATISVTGSAWDGTAGELMDQYNEVREGSDEEVDRLFAVSGARASFTTGSGLTGVQESYLSAGGDGRAFALVVDTEDGDPIGVVVAASASDESLGRFDTQIQDFVSSLTTTESAS